MHEEEWIIWKNVTSLVLFSPLCNISLNYAIHQYSIHKCIFWGKNDLKFLHNCWKWDLWVKVKIWRIWNAGIPYGSSPTAQDSKPKQRPPENMNTNSEQPVIAVDSPTFFQLQINLNEALTRGAQNTELQCPTEAFYLMTLSNLFIPLC